MTVALGILGGWLLLSAILAPIIGRFLALTSPPSPPTYTNDSPREG